MNKTDVTVHIEDGIVTAVDSPAGLRYWLWTTTTQGDRTAAPCGLTATRTDLLQNPAEELLLQTLFSGRGPQATRQQVNGTRRRLRCHDALGDRAPAGACSCVGGAP